MFRPRKSHQQRPQSLSSNPSIVAADAIDICDEAGSSVNLDHADYNFDGAELVSQARRIVHQATNQQIGGSDYDEYRLRLARNVLDNEHGRRLRFGEDGDEKQQPQQQYGSPSRGISRSSFSAFSQGLNEGQRIGFCDGFFEETIDNGAGSYRRAGTVSRKRWEGADEGEEEDESLFTTNIDIAEDPEPKSNRLARTFNPTDFKWLCLGGAVPLTMICGMSNGISYCGPLGMILGYIIVTPGIFVMLGCIAEMIAFYPMDGGFTLLVCEYIEDALGLAIGLLYWFNCALTVPIELLQCIKLLSVFPTLDQDDNSKIVFLTFYVLTLIVCSLMSTRAQSPAIRFASMVSMASLTMIVIIIWAVCLPSEINDGMALRFWKENSGFRPTDDIQHRGFLVNRWKQVAHACSLTLRSYNGIDVVFTAMPEIRNARRTIKSGFHWISVRMFVLYLVMVLSFTFVTDPHIWDVLNSEKLLKIHVCQVKPEYVNELMRVGIFCSFLTSLSRIDKCALFYMLNAFIVYCGVFDAGIQLYGASRTLHGLGYSGVLWKQLSWCTRERVPVVAVLISASIAFVAYASARVEIGKVFTYLQLYVTHAYIIVWATVCFAFIRYYRALKLQEKRTHVSRDSEDYPFKFRFQPYSAYLAIIWCLAMYIITTMEQYYYNLSLGLSMWKGNFVAAFLPIPVVAILYLGHKYFSNSKLVPLNQIGIMTAKRKMDAEEWEEDRVYSDGIKERVVRWFA